ncbi:MAG: hypothetical protein OEW67_13850 [Cyclobacteriaceae bacterium]|nr:hypothetical protein [Cyclobacteriaceae bacterium]
MKLRINKGNTLRIRMSQTEANELASTGKVEEVLNFGKATLVYTVESSSDESVSVDFKDNIVLITVNNSIINKWYNSDQVGFETTIPLPDGKSFYVLVEKDYKCLTKRPNEDESDLFENPLEKHKD